MSSRPPVVSVDLGGTSVKTALVGADGSVLRTRRKPTPQSGRDAVIEVIRDEVEAIGANAGPLLPVVGVGSPGMVDDSGVLHGAAVNIPGWHDFLMASRLQAAIGNPVIALNDATAAAMGEYTYGNYDDAGGPGTLALVNVGTGIGVGLVVSGRAYSGSSGAAGELGHLVIKPNGRRCACGNRGCVESYAAAAGVASHVRELAGEFSEEESGLAARLRGLQVRPEERSEATLEVIYEYLPKRDPLAELVHEQVCDALTRLTAILAITLAPERILFSGGVMAAAHYILPTVGERLRGFVLPHVYDSTTLSVARVGANAGLIGAAAAAYRYAEESL